MIEMLALSLLAAMGIALVTFWLGFFLPGPQWFGRTISHGDRKSKDIALTFDDGPNEPYTSRVLDILSYERVPAAFFVVGTHVQRYPLVVRRMIAEGHLVGNHT